MSRTPLLYSRMTLSATTVLCVRRDGAVAMASDGQVSHGATIVKHTASKVRRLHHGKVLAGFAGSAADSLALFGKLEAKLEEHGGNLRRAAVELAKDWRTDKFLRRLEAMMVAADKEHAFILSGQGDLLEPDDGAAGIGSGGAYALAAARALLAHTKLPAADIATESLKIAARICVYTNDNITVEML